MKYSIATTEDHRQLPDFYAPLIMRPVGAFSLVAKKDGQIVSAMSEHEGMPNITVGPARFASMQHWLRLIELWERLLKNRGIRSYVFSVDPGQFPGYIKLLDRLVEKGVGEKIYPNARENWYKRIF